MSSTITPVVVTALQNKAYLIREAARGLGVAYNELPVPGEPGFVRFSFGPLSESQTLKLSAAIPREAYALQGIIATCTSNVRRPDDA
jgi:hypothetical protein